MQGAWFGAVAAITQTADGRRSERAHRVRRSQPADSLAEDRRHASSPAGLRELRRREAAAAAAGQWRHL